MFSKPEIMNKGEYICTYKKIVDLSLSKNICIYLKKISIRT